MNTSEKGVSAVEFALITPLLLVITFGIIEFSILLFDKAVVTNASREVARAAIVYNVVYNETTEQNEPVPIAEDRLNEILVKYTDAYLISLGDSSEPVMSILYTEQGTPEPDDYVTVTVNYTYNFLVFQSLIQLISNNAFDDGITLVGTTVMRMEYQEEL